ncbi:MAG: response regulator [Tistlia sp.]|uniref:response regulator n=1 Tax=Tistlia sp. TaxID=3057121 RepID=UPI0034A3E28F
MQTDVPESGDREASEGRAAADGPDGEDLAAALEGLREPLFLCDGRGRIAYLNPALRRRLGVPPGDAAVGCPWESLFDGASRRLIEREALPAILREGHWRGPVALGRAVAPAPVFQLSLSAADTGGLLGLLLGGENEGAGPEGGLISRAEARSERLEALRRLAGDLSHDLNNALTSILGFARFLREDLPKDSQPHGFAGQIALAAEGAKRRLDEALAFARPGRRPGQAVAVGPVVAQACATLRPRLPDGTALDVEGDQDLAVEAEPQVFAEVLRQLLANAAEALEGRAGRLEVSWRLAEEPGRLPGLGKLGEPARVILQRQADGRRLLVAAGAPDPGRRFLELVVRDSGAGMTEAVLEHAFEPFFTTREPARGRGLGLSCAFGQALGQGGAILVDSAPGQGTAVRLLWPAAGAVPGEAPAPGDATGPDTAASAARRRLPRGRGQRILVAEDDLVLREALGEMLQRLGYRPLLVEDGERARHALAGGEAVEAVLTDRRMPKLSGTGLIEWMRAQDLHQPVLLCTGYGEDLDPASLSRVGAVTLLSKPIDAATLARSLDRLFAGQG